MRLIISVLSLLLLTSAVWAQTNIIPHITRANGGFTTKLMFENTGTTSSTITIKGYAADGSQVGNPSISLSTGVTEVLPETMTNWSGSLSHLTWTGNSNIAVSVVYASDQDGGSPAHLSPDQTAQNAWRFYAGDWQVVFDGVAFVNMGDTAMDVFLDEYAFDGTLKHRETIATALAPLAKALYVVGSPAGSSFSGTDSWFKIYGAEPLAITSLRGTPPPDARFLFENRVRASDMPEEPSSFEGITVTSNPGGPHAAFSVFTRYASVFGVGIYATSAVSEAKVQHAANVMAQYLDNDEDGQPDDSKIIDAMLSRGAFLFMFKNESTMESSGFEEELSDDFWENNTGQTLFGDETFPNSAEDVFDPTLEETLHLITQTGYAFAWPDQFGEESGTEIAEAMDKARGGHFEEVPNEYPEDAWYTYDDETCEYNCMIAEYMYWALTSILGAQDIPGRLEEIEHEWRLNTREKVENGDPDVFALLTDPRWSFATRIPDGNYDGE